MTSGAAREYPPEDLGRFRVIPSQVVASARTLIDHALDKVFDRPYAVRTPDDFERVMVEGSGTGALASAGVMAALVARATPWIERALPIARRSATAGKAAGKVVPAARMVTMALPVAIGLTTAIRHGVRELQVVASYLVHRLEEAGIDPDRDFVTALALSIALDPERRPDLGLTPRRTGAGLARRWILRSLGRDSPPAVLRRARADLAAIERLDFPALVKEWEERETS